MISVCLRYVLFTISVFTICFVYDICVYNMFCLRYLCFLSSKYCLNYHMGVHVMIFVVEHN